MKNIKFKIAARNYDLTFVKNLGRDHDAKGQSCGNGLFIRIDESLSNENQRDTLIHEVIEQINCIFDLDLTHQQISTIGASINQVITENWKTLNKFYGKRNQRNER